jgi:hypothetical protein
MPSAMPTLRLGTGNSVPWKICGENAPAIAMIDPTERSMPPVAMTKVMPTPTMTITQTWLRFTERV